MFLDSHNFSVVQLTQISNINKMFRLEKSSKAGPAFVQGRQPAGCSVGTEDGAGVGWPACAAAAAARLLEQPIVLCSATEHLHYVLLMLVV